MSTRVAPSAFGCVLPLLPLSAICTTTDGLTFSAPNVGDNVGDEDRSSGKYGRTSARYMRIVFDPVLEPVQPPELQEVGALGSPRTSPMILYPLKKACCPANN